MQCTVVWNNTVQENLLISCRQSATCSLVLLRIDCQLPCGEKSVPIALPLPDPPYIKANIQQVGPISSQEVGKVQHETMQTNAMQQQYVYILTWTKSAHATPASSQISPSIGSITTLKKSLKCQGKVRHHFNCRRKTQAKKSSESHQEQKQLKNQCDWIGSIHFYQASARIQVIIVKEQVYRSTGHTAEPVGGLAERFWCSSCMLHRW